MLSFTLFEIVVLLTYGSNFKPFLFMSLVPLSLKPVITKTFSRFICLSLFSFQGAIFTYLFGKWWA